MKKSNQHEWGFMANPGTVGTGDLCYCPLCNQWIMEGYKGGKIFKMSNCAYMEMYFRGEIDANEVLGTIEEAKKKYEERYGK